MFNVTKQGLLFKYHGDRILKYWPWVKRGFYNSQLFSRDFNSFREYWRLVGEESALVKASSTDGRLIGFMVEDILARWSSRLFVGEHIVVLLDIDPSKKGPSFWSRLTTSQKNAMLQDVVVLRCKDTRELMSLIDSIDGEFAVAYGFLNGELLYDNRNQI